MNNFNSAKKQQEDFLAKAKSRKDPTNYDVEGITVTVNPNVFPPSTDTKLLIANIHTKKGERILDLTTGSGPIAIAAGLQGASVVAVDINPNAVKNAKQNFQKYRLQIKAVKSDLFENVPKEKFDQIFTNGPAFEGEINDFMDYGCYGSKIFIEHLFSDLKNHLKNNGKLLIVRPAISDLEQFKKTCKNNKLTISLLSTRYSDDGKRKYNLYEIKQTATVL